MSIADTINGGFELFASAFILNHAWALWKSKQAYGISLVSTIFFGLWGLWNVFYYPHIGQMMSFYGGLAVLAANSVWIGLIIYLRMKEKGAAYNGTRTTQAAQ
jgi:hypothetical protein